MQGQEILYSPKPLVWLWGLPTLLIQWILGVILLTVKWPKIHLLLVLRLRMSVTIPLTPYTPSYCEHRQVYVYFHLFSQ